MRKGALSISTNAIVVLIVAVIMLGLIIGLVTDAFGTVRTQFVAGLGSEIEDPRVATSFNPIDIKPELLVGGPGEQIAVKLSVYLPDDGDTTSEPETLILTQGTDSSDYTGPSFWCKGAGQNIGSVGNKLQGIFFDKTVVEGESVSIEMQFVLPNDSEPGTYLCEMTGYSLQGQSAIPDTIPIPKTEFDLEVSST